MAFGGGSSGGGSTIAGAADVALSAVSAGDVISYDNSVSKWQNSKLTGRVAMATQGGAEGLSSVTASGATTLNLAQGNVFRATLNGNTTFSFTGAVTGAACSFSLYIQQGSAGGRTVTWPTSVRWSGGAPTLTTTANAVDIVVFETIDGGTTWYGSLVGTNFQ